MVSRRNFFSMILMMLVLLFMFQFSQIVKVSGNDYDVNEYVQNEVPDGTNAWEAESKVTKVSDEVIFFLGKANTDLGKVVEEWCSYRKKDFKAISEVADVKMREGQTGFLLIDSKVVDFETETELLKELSQSGMTLVFCNLPQPDVIRGNKNLRLLLGISKVEANEVEVEGIRIFSGFLLGGEAVYQALNEEMEKDQDLTLTMPWYFTGIGTKSYAVGLMDEDEVKREKFPDIIWRSTTDNTMVFSVNGDYMSDLTAFGILDAITYEAREYVIYPVVNANNILITDVPVLANENETQMQTLYNRDLKAALRDVMWPGIVSMASHRDLKLTCFINTKYDYMDADAPNGEDLKFYLQQMNEIDAEAGKSLNFGEGITLLEKAETDEVFYEENAANYRFSALYVEEANAEVEALLKNEKMSEELRTITTDYQEGVPLLSYYNDVLTRQAIMNRAEKYSYTADLRTKSILSSIGYSNTVVTMQNVVFPRTEEDYWENYFDEIFSNVSSYWGANGIYENTTLSQSDTRVRQFLNLDYRVSSAENVISLGVSGIEKDAWFVLRVHNKMIVDIENAEYEEVETGAYLIHTYSNNVKIYLENDEEEVLFYQGPFKK